MKLGITNTTYTSPYGKSQGYERMKAHGYDYADYQGFINTESEFFSQTFSSFEKALAEERAIAEGSGIRFSQAHGPWRYPPREGTAKEIRIRIDEFKKSIYGTAVIGSPNWIIHPLMPFGADTDERAEEMVEVNRIAFSEICEYAKTFGITVCLENMPFLNLPIASVGSVVDFVRGLGCDDLKVCLDTGHSAVFGDNLADAVKLVGNDLLATLHVHDNDGKRDAHRRPGDGVIDWLGFNAALKEIGYEGVYSLECAPHRDKDQPENWERNELALVETALRHINSIK